MISLFFSYSYKDEALRDRLKVHLPALQSSGAISTWHDGRTTATAPLVQQIDEHLLRAAIILPLVSADLLASNHHVEMQRGRRGR